MSSIKPSLYEHAVAYAVENFDRLSRSVRLAPPPTAAVLGKSLHTLQKWRLIRGHPLRWHKTGRGRNCGVTYTVGDIRDFMARDDEPSPVVRRRVDRRGGAGMN